VFVTGGVVSSQGKGIYIIDDISEVPIDE
jgi:CTP synthase (UTP-ammonia lyase)